jgi:hypothetical protein
MGSARRSLVSKATSFYGRGGADDGYAMLGPHSNAHGPNEFLHVPTARRVSPVIAQVLADHAARSDAA